MNESFKIVYYINASPEEIWQAWTNPEVTKKVFFNCEFRSTQQVGDRYEYVSPGNDGEETVHVYGQILEWIPYEKLVMTEHPGPIYRENHAELGTRVTFQFERVGGCTKVTLISDQWPSDHPARHKAEDDYGSILSGLKTYMETKQTLDFGW